MAIRTRRSLFGNLREIPTDQTIVPPSHSCFNCWRKRHNRSRCPLPTGIFCYSYGRREATLCECPRWGERAPALPSPARAGTAEGTNGLWKTRIERKGGDPESYGGTSRNRYPRTTTWGEPQATTPPTGLTWPRERDPDPVSGGYCIRSARTTNRSTTRESFEAPMPEPPCEEATGRQVPGRDSIPAGGGAATPANRTTDTVPADGDANLRIFPANPPSLEGLAGNPVTRIRESTTGRSDDFSKYAYLGEFIILFTIESRGDGFE